MSSDKQEKMEDRVDPALILSEQCMFSVFSFLVENASESFTVQKSKGNEEREETKDKGYSHDEDHHQDDDEDVRV